MDTVSFYLNKACFGGVILYENSLYLLAILGIYLVYRYTSLLKKYIKYIPIAVGIIAAVVLFDGYKQYQVAYPPVEEPELSSDLSFLDSPKEEKTWCAKKLNL